MQQPRKLSIIMPVLNEAAIIEQALSALMTLRDRGTEIIVVDGGSADDTASRAMPHADRVLTSGSGRAEQMNAGALAARGSVLLFVHADTRLPENVDSQLERALIDDVRCWGRFDVCIEGTAFLLPAVAWLMNHRSRLTGIATGDQAMFVTQDAFERVGGFPQQALMEDIELARRLKRLSPPARLRTRVTTSGRRWEKNGVLRTIMLMWCLRLAYACGVAPERLARWYGQPG